MFSDRHLPAIAAGALVTLLLAGPAAIVQRLLADDATVGDRSNWVYLALAVVVAAYLLGGACAGFNAPLAPFLNGALATTLGFSIIQAVAIVIRLARGDDVSPVALTFNALLAASIGAVGAGLGTRLGSRPGVVDNDVPAATMDPGGGEPTG